MKLSDDNLAVVSNFADFDHLIGAQGQHGRAAAHTSPCKIPTRLHQNGHTHVAGWLVVVPVGVAEIDVVEPGPRRADEVESQAEPCITYSIHAVK